MYYGGEQVCSYHFSIQNGSLAIISNLKVYIYNKYLTRSLGQEDISLVRCRKFNSNSDYSVPLSYTALPKTLKSQKMADGGLTVLDGTQLRSVDYSLQEPDGTITGDRVLKLAESIASSSLFGLTLPESLKSSALSRLNVDDVSFRRTELRIDQASAKIKDFISAIADELQGV